MTRSNDMHSYYISLIFFVCFILLYRDELRLRIQLSESAPTLNNYVHIDFTIGAPGKQLRVCKSTFAKAHGRGKTFINEIIQEVKEGVVVTQPSFGDQTTLSEETIARLLTVGEAQSIRLLPNDIGSARLRNNPNDLACQAWMQFNFAMSGDCQPNREGEIHLEPCVKNAIYNEYVRDQEQRTPALPSVGLDEFYRIWKDVFPHVKIRKYKSVNGKCNCCADLSQARRLECSSAVRGEYTALFGFHRITFMNERRTYYDRRHLAVSQPHQYFSTITDGMAQIHCELPYRKGMTEFKKKVACHLQGIIAHGHSFTVYRTFTNIKADSNLAIHVWLLELEGLFERNGNKLPDVLFHQIDGGSENANRAQLAIAELLVAKGLCKKVVLTRLPPGHTHEDIDAKFGSIWTKFRFVHCKL